MAVRNLSHKLSTMSALLLLPFALTGIATAQSINQQSADQQQITTHEQINSVVLSYLESFFSEAELSGSSADREVRISMGYLDPRLRFKTCTIPLTASMNRNQRPLGKISIKVACHSSSYWSKLISAEIQVYEPVLVAARPIARGTIVDASDLEIVNMDVSMRRNTYLRERDQHLVIGQQAKRNINLRYPIDLGAFKQPMLVKRGDSVTITAQHGPIKIRQEGKALQDGWLGKQIDIRNSASNRVIRATVVGPQRVSVVF